MTKKARVEGSAPGAPSEAVTLADRFRAEFPDEWEMIRTWPTESGLIFITEKMKG